MTAFSYSSLWTKSKVLIDRAIRARDERDTLGFYIWAATALELLGKSVLARVHPSLVADPSHFPSLLAACRTQSATVTLRSVTARTLYDRLHALGGGFDEPMKREALLMAERRNAELHSGEAPTQGLDPAHWVPTFWRIVRTLLSMQGRRLDEWLGQEEAARVTAILANAGELAKQMVEARIARRKAEYDAAFPLGSKERNLEEKRALTRPLPRRFYGKADAEEDCVCPSCGTKGWLFGFKTDEETIGYESPDEHGFGYAEVVRSTYSAEEFRCPQCNLALEGLQELEYAGLPTEFSYETLREPDYEPEYGNE